MNGISTWCQLTTPKEAASLQDGFSRVSPPMTLGPLLSDSLAINYFNFGGLLCYNYMCKYERVQRGSLVLSFGGQVLECLYWNILKKSLRIVFADWLRREIAEQAQSCQPSCGVELQSRCGFLLNLNLNKGTLLIVVFVPVLTSYF